MLAPQCERPGKSAPGGLTQLLTHTQSGLSLICQSRSFFLPPANETPGSGTGGTFLLKNYCCAAFIVLFASPAEGWDEN